MASRLDRTWKEFAAGLDERTSVLGLSVLFHHKAEQYCDSVASWGAACEATQPLPSEIQSLETAIRTHQSLYEAMCQAYTEVSECPRLNIHMCFSLVCVLLQAKSLDPIYFVAGLSLWSNFGFLFFCEIVFFSYYRFNFTFSLMTDSVFVPLGI